LCLASFADKATNGVIDEDEDHLQQQPSRDEIGNGKIHETRTYLAFIERRGARIVKLGAHLKVTHARLKKIIDRAIEKRALHAASRTKNNATQVLGILQLFTHL
jgi:hypothetical protein